MFVRLYNRLMISKTSLLRWVRLDEVKAMTAAPPRVEFQQALLRVFISALVLAYVIWYVGRAGAITDDKVEALFAAAAFFAFAVAITVRILQAPGISKSRRVLGIVVDNVVASYGLIVLGEGGAVILGTYLLVTVGNGLRYGRYYLTISHFLSVTGFSLVMLVSPYWSQHNAMGLGVLLTLLVIPFYVGHLAKGIDEVRQRAEDANQAKDRKIAELEEKIAERDR